MNNLPPSEQAMKKRLRSIKTHMGVTIRIMSDEYKPLIKKLIRENKVSKKNFCRY